MSIKSYLQSFGDLPLTDKHSAQLLGAAEAYFPQRKRSYQRDLRAIHDVLFDSEDVKAAFPCSIRRKVVVQIGLLVVTTERLLHVQASIRHVHPKIHAYSLKDLQRIELTVSHPDNTRVMLCHLQGETVEFSFLGRYGYLLNSVRETMRRAVDVPIDDSWPRAATSS